MSLEKIESLFEQQLKEIDAKGVSKRNELVISERRSPENGFGPRYCLVGFDQKSYLRFNSNSYLGLECEPTVIEAEAKAAEQFGTGPGAVRFISGTSQLHKELEQNLADFHGRQAAMIYSSAYAAMLSVLPQLVSEQTLIVSDALNHNCIINAVRLSKCAQKKVYAHLDMKELENILQDNMGRFERVCVVSDGVFSMRGDFAATDQINAICNQYQHGYEQGIITVIDDSHGVGAFGKTGRGTEETCQAKADVLIATLGKAFAVNGGYVVTSAKVIEYLKETAPLYIYSNPITPAESAAAARAITIVDSQQGQQKLATLHQRTEQLRKGLTLAGYKTLPGQHPVVPILIGDTAKTVALVEHLFEHQILVTGLSYPVVPKGQEEIRVQVSAEHTEKDIAEFLAVLAQAQE